MSIQERLNQLLHSTRHSAQHVVIVGQSVSIPLPSVPLTADTEFVQLRADLSGVDGSAAVAAIADYGRDGLLAPTSLQVTGVRPGRGVIRLAAEDALSGKPIEGVRPIEIEITVQAR